jgi:transcription-repair coupling factor (superfamily II helicase)
VTSGAPPRSAPAIAAGAPGLLDDDRLERLAREPGFARLLRVAAEGGRVHAGGLWGSSAACVLAALTRRAQGPWVVLASTESEAEVLVDDLAAFGAPALLLPDRETMGSRRVDAAADPDSVRERLQVAQRITGPPERRPRLIVASLLSLLQPLPSPRDLEADFLQLQVGARFDAEKLLARLVAAGFARQPLVEQPGEVSLRGDIVDVFPFASDLPVRIELFDERVESLRFFDPDTQRSVESVDRIAVCIASDVGGVEDGRGLPVADLVSPAAVYVEIEPLRVADQAEGLRIRSTAHTRALSVLRERMEHHPQIALQSLPGDHVDFGTLSVQALSVGLKAAPEALRAAAATADEIVVLFRTEAEERRFAEVLDNEGAEGNRAPIPGLRLALGSVARGFRFPALRTTVVNQRELAGVLGARARNRPQPHHRVRALQSFFELKTGDLVVHAVHGVARYAGLKRMTRAGGEEEHLHLLFADDVSLFVPAGRIELVQRYVGGGSAAPSLDKLGSQSFRRRKEKVEKALVDLAAELLAVQAKRETRKRPPWEPPPDQVRDLLASFPYVDTADQARADEDIAADLAGARPMDRLLCGDVGFGKTEIAVRAAFRVVASGAQVAVLVPTTVLAQQHGETFRERLAPFAVEVATLSRYVTGKEARERLKAAAEGKLDILVGTHRILSKDVAFKNLGLVIVDEEQRFGVKHKEHFKGLRASIDVLTLTATPIPRTLHMSLAGIRDISGLSEAPEGRQEIETILAYEDDDGLIRDALLREKSRGGQAFFLHNRVGSIEARARHLAELVPECSFAVGHGQMHGNVLRRVMETFTRGDVDVLVATTIVENGIDIPAAGTILMDQADHFGLAELHQLRGRVGRGRHKAHCFLLIDRAKPVGQQARERLKALEELTQLGAGFQISMKDLELRGAGNILGPEQSGHIAAIGYDMYCRLLKETVERMTHGTEIGDSALRDVPAAVERDLEAEAVELELGIEAFLPKEWIPTAEARLELLRRLAHLASDAELDEARAELRDRYGRIPPPADALLRQFRLRPKLSAHGIRRLLWRGETYVVEYADRVALEGLLRTRKIEIRPFQAGQAHLVVPAAYRRDATTALAWFEGLLPADAPANTLSAS